MADPNGKLVTPTGFNPSGVPRALELDANDYLKVAIAAWLEGQVDTMGYVGGAWHKNPILFGYSATMGRVWYNTDLPAGDSAVSDTAVPAGVIWVMTNLNFTYIGTVPTSVDMDIVLSGSESVVYRQNAPVSGAYYDRQGWWVMGPGDLLRLRVAGGTLHNQLHGRGVGFKVDIGL